jgi:hypothetical protein
VLWLYVHLSTRAGRLLHRRANTDRGQASAEYALVLLGAAAIALLVGGWATHTNKIGKLLDSVIGKLLDHVR